MDFAHMAELCAPGVPVATLSKIAFVESSFNPYAIGVVGGRLQRQPRDLSEALATANMLRDQGFNYSVGIVQVNKKNFTTYGLTHETAFDACTNLKVGSLIFQDCYKRAGGSATAYGDALSCYYSGNFKTGYRLGYVDKVQNALSAAPSSSTGLSIPVISQTTAKPSRKPASATPTIVEPLFVTAVAPPLTTASPKGDSSPTSNGASTALLF